MDILLKSIVRILFIYSSALQAQKPTYDLQIVVFADSWLDIGVVLHSGHTLQVAIVVQSEDHGEDCNLPIQGRVHTQSLVPLPRPGK